MLGMLAAALAAPAHADANRSDAKAHGSPSNDRSTVLAMFRCKLDAAAEMAAAREITNGQRAEATTRLIREATKAAGSPVALEQLLAVTCASLPAMSTVGPKLTALQKLAGLVTVTNIAWVAAGVLVLVALILLYQWFLRGIPPEVWEILLYLTSIALLIIGHRLHSGIAEHVVFVGSLVFTGAWGFTWFFHKLGESTSRFDGKVRTREEVFFLVLTVALAGIALGFTNAAVGFVAVMALMGALGFSVAVIPCGYVVGFKDDDAVARGTFAALFILVGFVLLRVFGTRVPALAVFEGGAYWMGAFVGYLGLLIISSKWYTKENYGIMQVVMVVAGVLALVVGSVFHISELQKIGGTFFGLWAVEKLAEIPVASKEGVAVLCLVVAGVLAGGAWYVSAHLDTFAPYLIGA
ncbi:hypothetical protein HY634_03220 [Candidatus Uhrbacteria bacterium]|nr:hypothetical protein [Candidatus Uhrbacteria bacterium]